MVETIIARIVGGCCRHPRLTLIVALLIAFGAGLYSYQNFAIQTDTGELFPSQLPWRQRELRLDAAFPQLVDTILVVVDGDTPELARDGSRRLTAKPAEDRGNLEAVGEEGWGPVLSKDGPRL